MTDPLSKVTAYEYDDAGRLVRTTFPTGVVETRSYTAADQLTSIVAAKGGTTLVSFAYTLDNAGLRHQVSAGGTTTYTRDLNRELPLVLSDGELSHVYGHGLISQTTSSGQQTSVLADGLGSMVALTDGSGTVTARYRYDGFGALRASSGTGRTVFRFAGQQLDGAAGLYYLRARYYDPALGRFLSRDPFPGTASLPASQHPYRYAHDNPTNWTDPSGRCRSPCSSWAVGRR